MPRCDICNKELADNEGYLLTTAQVTASVVCWKRFINNTAEEMTELLDNPNLLSRVVFARGSSDSPWQVCEACSSMFEFDHDHARSELMRFHQTGEPSGGFAICQLNFQGRNLVADPLDMPAWEIMLESVNTAIKEIRQERSLPSMDENG